jgi:hypothetical protein
MLLFDVNVLIYATHENAVDHQRYRDWLDAVINGTSAFGVADLVLSGYLRIITNRKVFAQPATIEDAIAVTEKIRTHPNCVVIAPGPRHWDIFVDLCTRANARGNLVPDAYLAALAIES